MFNLTAVFENIRMALRALTANKLRATLTMLGIIIGVTAVITLVSVGRGVEKYIGDAFGSLGSDLLYVMPGTPKETSSGPPTQVLQGNVAIGAALTMKDVEALRDPLRVPDAARVSPEVQTVAAVARGAAVVPVYIWDDDGEGWWPLGGAARWWLHHALAALDASLREVGSRLIYARGNSADVLRELVRTTGAGAVYWNRRYEPAAIARDPA